ncbi:MAG: hypothetical protein CMP98_02560 [Gammaproteobacteria bacterium]|nr:hypothetical protein [Gammaproteobacteria bacterium]OUU11406.1 MAG: hypothetical protein CBB94_02665 [Gammaproteobacteria bacterium TMED34]
MSEETANQQAFIIPAPIRAGRYEARLADTADEVYEAQKLRYRVMYAEKGGRPDLSKVRRQADIDEWDPVGHHIVVMDTRVDHSTVMGTLRLVSNFRLAQDQRFYSERAFDLSGLRGHYSSILELGRFCIADGARQGAILMLIWKYAMQFIVDNRIEVMVGCASFPGTDVDDHIDVLSYLYHNNVAPESVRPRPVVDHVRIDDIKADDVDFESAAREVPTLLRGYLKLGARVSDAAIVDPVFNSTFLCIYVDASEMLAENTVLVTAR